MPFFLGFLGFVGAIIRIYLTLISKHGFLIILLDFNQILKLRFIVLFIPFHYDSSFNNFLVRLLTIFLSIMFHKAFLQLKVILSIGLAI